MAVGDVLAVKIKATAAGTIVFQPAAGVEYAITHLAAKIVGATAGNYGIYDGVDYVPISNNTSNGGSIAGVGAIASNVTNPAAADKLFITNSVYLALSAGQSGDVLYIFGVQTK